MKIDFANKYVLWTLIIIFLGINYHMIGLFSSSILLVSFIFLELLNRIK